MNKQMCTLVLARRRLWCMLACSVILIGVFAIPWILHPLPTAMEWPWLVDVLGVVAPELLLNAARFAATFPWLTMASIVWLWALRRALRSIGRAEHELALHGGPGYSPTIWANTAKGISQLHWLVAASLVILVGVISVDFLRSANPKGSLTHEPAAEVLCTGVRGNCRLAEGETVRVAIRSDRINHTGIWLDAGATYSLRSLATSEWTDDEITAPAAGFSSDNDLIPMERFWWAEWLRPLPDALWFRIVGRVDSDGPEFPALGEDPFIPYSWQPPHDGELVLLVNDIILNNNTGTMTLELHRAVASRTPEGR